MWSSQLDPKQLKEAYGILCQGLLPNANVQPPFGATWCVIEPGKATVPHDHLEGETFLIWKGIGQLTFDAVYREVLPGDIVYLPSGGTHRLRNVSNVNLEFVSLYWEPASARCPSGEGSIAIHAAPPTPNGPLHLGHLAGPYLAADVLRRHLARFGRQAHLLCGTDDNQSYVASKAASRNESADQTIGEFGSLIRRGFAAAGIDFQGFLEPSRDADQRNFVGDYFSQLIAAGKLERRPGKALHCEPCGRYLYEVYVAGGCPHCAEPTLGNGCESCGLPNQPEELIDPRCRECGGTPILKRYERWYLPLSQYQGALEDFWQRVGKTPVLASFLENLRRTGLQDLPVSHYDRWGICVPGSADGEVIHVWFEMAASYLFAEQKRGLVHPDRILCFGFDNAFYYSAVVPALWLAGDAAARLPSRLVTNEFLQLDGAKFSTSRGHAVWALDALPALPLDLVRSFLLSIRPETRATNFTLVGLQSHAVRLDQTLNQWLFGLDEIVREDFDATVPASGILDGESISVLAGWAVLARDFEARLSPATWDLAGASRVLQNFLEEVTAYGLRQAPLRHSEAYRLQWARSVQLQLAAARWLAHGAEGWFPEICTRLRAAFGDLTPCAGTLSDGPAAGSSVGILSSSQSFESSFAGWARSRQPAERNSLYVQL